MPLTGVTIEGALRAPLAKQFRLGPTVPTHYFNTGSATAGAATLNSRCGVVTSESITTAAGAAYTLTLTNSQIDANTVVVASVQNGTNTQGALAIGTITPAAGSVAIVVRNVHASQALNGTVKISFSIVNPA